MKPGLLAALALTTTTAGVIIIVRNLGGGWAWAGAVLCLAGLGFAWRAEH